MSRRVLQVQESMSLYDEYANIKSQFDLIKKRESDFKDRVKSKLIEEGLDEYSGKNYKITLSKTENTSIDVDKLITTLISEYNKTDLINMGVFEEKIIVNEDKLQEMIYENKIDGSLLTGCLIRKPPTYTLRFKENK